MFIHILFFIQKYTFQKVKYLKSTYIYSMVKKIINIYVTKQYGKCIEFYIYIYMYSTFQVLLFKHL